MKILIVGVRKPHLIKLRNEFPSMEINGVDSNTNHDKPLDSSRFDYIISMTKFTSHTTHRNYKNHRGYYPSNGGISTVVKLLANIDRKENEKLLIC